MKMSVQDQEDNWQRTWQDCLNRIDLKSLDMEASF